MGDIQYELEIYPRLIYFDKVSEEGQKPFEHAVIDHKFDNKVLKDLKMDKIPLYELSMTKKSTCDMILKHLTEFFD